MKGAGLDLLSTASEILLTGLVLFLVAALISPRLTWALRKPFLITNHLQWVLTFPFRPWFQNPKSNWPRRFYLAAFPLILLYNLLIYILLIPIRLVNAVYFDLALFWSVSLRDGVADLLFPEYRFRDTREFIYKWFSRFPSRLWKFLVRYTRVIFQGIAMTIFDLVWPTLTLFHGTGREAAEKIARTGRWHAGGGDYAGTGIYFGLVPDVAEHYARHNSDPIVIVARVNLTPCRPIATLTNELRRLIGGSGGDALSCGLGSPWAALEHFRKDGSWYEFCLVQRSKFKLVSPWRIRPICIAGPVFPERVPGGLVPWPKTRRSWRLAGMTGIIFLVFASTSGYEWSKLQTQLESSTVVGSWLSKDGQVVNANQQVNTGMKGCDGVLVSRLQNGEDACVVPLNGSALRFRSEPGFGEESVIGFLHSGQRLDVLEGPACVDGYLWWKLSTSEGVSGWAAEGDDRQYFLEECR